MPFLLENIMRYCVEAVMELGMYTYEEFKEIATKFHGYPAPGIMLGAYMVELAKEKVAPYLENHGLYNAISETGQCLPDAIQLLTPCTVGNGWLTVYNTGRYAMSLFNKYTGRGVRVYLDYDKLNDYPAVLEWLMKLKPKREQNSDALQEEIKQAKYSIFSVQEITALPEFYGKHSKGAVVRCALCHEPIPAKEGIICKACQGKSPYCTEKMAEIQLKAVPVEEAAGKRALHDMTKIVPDEFKGAQFLAGQALTGGDMCELQRMGKNQIYVVDEENPQQNQSLYTDTGIIRDIDTPQYIHENECAKVLGELLGGKYIQAQTKIREGKISFVAEKDGVLWLDEARLQEFNRYGDVIAVTRKQASRVKKGQVVASSRAVPLYLTKQQWLRAKNVLSRGALFSLYPLRQMKMGILVTGTEVFSGLIEDKFAPIISKKAAQYDCTVMDVKFAPDNRERIYKAVQELREDGAELIVTTAGLSVDPDDVTRKALEDAGLQNYMYGMPVLPGAMSLVGEFKAQDELGACAVIGVPACALFHKITAFDVLLPLVLAGVPLDRDFFAGRAGGGLCENCEVCTYPHCRFAV